MFSSNEKAMACWSWEENVGFDPFKLKETARIKAEFICDVCFHLFDIAIYSIKTGSWWGEYDVYKGRV